jgi:hypothetical protein
VTVSYPLYAALKKDFSYKIVVTVTCVVNTFAPSKSSDTVTFYFDGSTTSTFTLATWSQTNTGSVPNTECSYAETFTMTGATADTDKLTINNAARTLTWNLAQVTTKYTTGSVAISSAITLFDSSTQSAGGYSVVVNFIPKECETFQIKMPNILAMSGKKY